MIYVALGITGFVIIHLFDLVSVRKVPIIKPLIWFLGCAIATFGLINICLTPEKLNLPWWSLWLGWVGLGISAGLLFYSLFINLPFRRTYITKGVGKKLVKTQFYALVRHPGVMWFILLMVSLILVSRSSLLLIAAPIFIVLDVGLVVMQDRVFFVRMFAGYRRYQMETPMLVPNKNSIRAFFSSLKNAERQVQRR